MRKIISSDALWYLISLLALLLLAAINIYQPFLADQSVVIAGAKGIERGDVLYVDFWDNKMPGLFWFYWLAGKLFSFNEKGIHLFELVWMLGFAAAMAVGLRRYLYFPWLSSVAPLAVIGIYYASAGANHLTLPEIIVCFPLFVCALFSMWAGQRADKVATYFFISGLFAGASVVFKLIFAPICVAFWLVSCGFIVSRERRSLGWLVRSAFLPVSGGVTLILSLVVIKFALDGALAELLWTAFSYPNEALAGSPFAGMQRLFVSSMYIATRYAVWLVPICVAIYAWFKSEKDIFTTTMLAWLVVGLAVILVQRFSWWGYHFFLIFPPLGLLGVRGIDVLVKKLTNGELSARAISAILALTFILPLVSIANEKAEIAIVTLVFEDKPVTHYRSFVRRDYAVALASTKFLRQNESLPGDIIVFGDPLYYHLGNRYPAIPMLGWPWEYFLQSQWLALPAQIEAAAAPYIFIADREMKMMEKRGGGVKEFIFSRYIALHRAQEGTWLQIKREFR